jgi:hypothetical protein
MKLATFKRKDLHPGVRVFHKAKILRCKYLQLPCKRTHGAIGEIVAQYVAWVILLS